MNIRTTELRLINPSKNQNKFYRLTVNGHTKTVLMQWGRIGTIGQRKIEDYSQFTNAHEKRFQDKITEKRKKGYQFYSSTDNGKRENSQPELEIPVPQLSKIDEAPTIKVRKLYFDD